MDIDQLVVCDGHNIAYRSFFAIRNLSTDRGVPTNAVFGFVRQVERLRRNLNPSHMVVVFDGGIPERRMDLLETYKAQRPEMPEDLRSQMALIERYLEAVRICSITVVEEEADDVMATIADKSVSAGANKVLLATSDKDMFQMVDARILICEPTGEHGLMGPEGVRAKTGVNPESIVDWLALVGDSADNIPGIAGVGPKTAAKLLNRFGSIDAIFENIDKVKSENLRSKLKAGRKLLRRNRDLMALDRNVPLDIEWEKMVLGEPDRDSLLAFFDELQFHGMAKDLREPKLF